MRGRVFAAVPAAGAGRRLGLGYSKAYASLGGWPLLVRTVKALLVCPSVDRVWTAVRREDVDLCRREVVEKAGLTGQVEVLAGGEERQDTVYSLLGKCSSDRDLVLIHDGARPFVTAALAEAVLAEAEKSGAALAALPVSDTVKLSEDGTAVERTLDRAAIWVAQTPQCFQRDVILAAARRAHKEGYRGTDDASLVEWMGQRVHLVQGERSNIKVTTPEDLEYAKWLLGRGK